MANNQQNRLNGETKLSLHKELNQAKNLVYFQYQKPDRNTIQVLMEKVLFYLEIDIQEFIYGLKKRKTLSSLDNDDLWFLLHNLDLMLRVINVDN